ncbi:MAG: hypothetical protein M3Y25_10095 [Thermoproteota archaeon]|nr:hypothetical protein [Thermoproteota archaeon]
MIEHNSEFYQKLAFKWAPINYQHIRLFSKNNYYQTKKDLLVPITLNFYKQIKNNLKSCWDTKYIRKRLREIDLEFLLPVVYYSVAETETHYFILYAFYHADDDMHPNDLEGCLLILEEMDLNEVLLGMITVAHHDFWLYAYEKSIKQASGKEFPDDFNLEVDMDIDFLRPLIQQEVGKHGLNALGTKINRFTKIMNWLRSLLSIYPDVVVYAPGDKPRYYDIKSILKGRGTAYSPTFQYELVDILDHEEGFWKRWHDRPNSTFQENGQFHGGAANPPWLWKELGLNIHNKDEVGLIWYDPAKLINRLFKPGKGRKDFSSKYVRHMDGTV